MPAEAHVVAAVRARHGAAADPAFFVRRDRATGEQVFISHAGGTCVFRSNDRCAIHARGGVTSLPVSCRHFPRVVLRDGRGTIISFSHYCPTAAALLLEHPPAIPRICDGTAQQPLEPIEGLDARDALPPLLRPGMLTDVAGYDAWERAVIQTFSRSRLASEAFLKINCATDAIRQWKPGNGSLAAAAATAFALPPKQTAAAKNGFMPLDVVRRLYRGELDLEAPWDLETAWRAAAPPNRTDLQRGIANYLAARTFGNWVAYQGLGLRSIVAWLHACHDVLRVAALRGRSAATEALTPAELLEAFRATDLVMLHTIDSHEFARAASAVEFVV